MKKTIIRIIRIIAIIALLVSLTVLGVYIAGDIRDARVQSDIEKLKGSSPDDEKPPEILDEYAALYGENDDVIGWLKIDGTSIDYVVMHAPDEPEKYLHHDFYGRSSYRGCLYVDEHCDVLHSDNIIIYGHHMKDGSMFGDLMDYSYQSFYNKHKYITFDTIYEKHTYEIVAAIKTRIPDEDEECFRYYAYTGENDVEMFKQYEEFIEENRLYDTDAELKDGDKLLTLSTCAYHSENGRFIVVARQIS